MIFRWTGYLTLALEHWKEFLITWRFCKSMLFFLSWYLCGKLAGARNPTGFQKFALYRYKIFELLQHIYSLLDLIDLEWFSFECRKVIGFASTALSDWLKKLAPLFHPIRSKTKPVVTHSHLFSRALRQPHVIVSSFDWFIGSLIMITIITTTIIIIIIIITRTFLNASDNHLKPCDDLRRLLKFTRTRHILIFEIFDDYGIPSTLQPAWGNCKQRP